MKISYAVHMDGAFTDCVLEDGECVTPAHWNTEEMFFPDACERHLYRKMQGERFDSSQLRDWIEDWSREEGVAVDIGLAEMVVDKLMRRLTRRKLIAYDTTTRSMEWIGRKGGT